MKVNDSVMFFVPGEPKGKGRPRFARRGKNISTYTPRATADYESAIKRAAESVMGGRQPLAGRVSLEARIRFQVPKSWSKKKQAQAIAGEISPTGKPDIDNVLKAIGDALNGVVFVDDSQICSVAVSKSYGDPGVLVSVSQF